MSEGLPSALARELARVMNSPPGHTWVKVYTLPRGHYGEDGPPPPTGPVFVKVLRGNLPSEKYLREEVKGITQEVHGLLGVAREVIHVCYEPPLRGRISFGGEFLGK